MDGPAGRPAFLSYVLWLTPELGTPRSRLVAPVATPDVSFSSFFPLVSRFLFLSRLCSALRKCGNPFGRTRIRLFLVRLRLGLDFLSFRSLESRIILHKWAVTEYNGVDCHAYKHMLMLRTSGLSDRASVWHESRSPRTNARLRFNGTLWSSSRPLEADCHQLPSRHDYQQSPSSETSYSRANSLRAA